VKDRQQPVGEQMMKKVAFLGTAAALLIAGISPAAAQFQAALDVSSSTTSEAKASQQRVDTLDEEADRLVQEYRVNLKQLELVKKFNESRSKEVERQLADIERLKADLENVEGLQMAMIPLMEEMLAKLELFVAADSPFLSQERDERVARLKRTMGDSEISPAQKYRLIVEAYQIENEYGTTLETYSDTVEAPEGEILVEFLRIGRSALIYKTDDNSVLRIYDRKAGEFVDLPKSFLEDVRYGIRMAKQQTPPDFLPIPVGAPQ
jgi:uncharacterized protein DUF3450